MLINIKRENIVNAEEHYILHQVNCKGKMGSGVALAIRNKWDDVYLEYIEFLLKNPIPLGRTQHVYVDNHIILNLFGQDNYGYDSKRYTNYEAMYTGLCEARDLILALPGSPQTLAMPFKIGCVRGGAE